MHDLTEPPGPGGEARDPRTPDTSLTGAVARILQSLRAERGWSLDQLAGKSGVNKGVLVALEQGRSNPNLATLARSRPECSGGARRAAPAQSSRQRSRPGPPSCGARLCIPGNGSAVIRTRP